MVWLGEAVLVLVSGVFDRFRGDADLGLPAKALNAAVCGLITGYMAFGLEQPSYLLAFAALFIGAIGISYGGPWGALVNGRELVRGEGKRKSWWMVGILHTNAPVSMIARGLLGAIVVSPVCYKLGVYSPMAGIFLGFNVAPYVSRYMFDHDLVPQWLINRFGIYKKPRWNFAEIVRGVLIPALTRVLPL